MQERRIFYSDTITQDDIPSTAREWNPNDPDAFTVTANVIYVPLGTNPSNLGEDFTNLSGYPYAVNKQYIGSYNGGSWQSYYFYARRLFIKTNANRYNHPKIFINDNISSMQLTSGDTSSPYINIDMTAYMSGYNGEPGTSNTYQNLFGQLIGAMSVYKSSSSTYQYPSSSRPEFNPGDYVKVKFAPGVTFTLVFATSSQVKRDPNIEYPEGWSTWEYPIYIDTE